MNPVVERLAGVHERIAAAGGDPQEVTVVAVTKGFGVDAVQAALGAGLVDVGENYAQELVAKAEALEETPRWHFIGQLQRNKVRKIVGHVELWQSVDRLSLGEEIARWAPGAAVLVQVDISGETTKGGCPPGDVPALVEALATLGLEVRGLMVVGPLGAPEEARPGFRLVRETAQKCGLSELSMGMSGDLEVAIQEGATMVRIGAALFGPRPGRAGMEH